MKSSKLHYFILSIFTISFIRAKNIPIDFLNQPKDNLNNNVKESKRSSWELVDNRIDKNDWNIKENDVIFNWKPGYNIGIDVHVKKPCPSHISDQGYKCCVNECTYIHTDSSGNWSIENGEWCWCSMNNYGNEYGYVYGDTDWMDNSQTDLTMNSNKNNNSNGNEMKKITHKKEKNINKISQWKGSLSDILSNWKNNNGYGVSSAIQDKCPSSEEGYKCCEANCVSVYTDSNGNWGFENGEWCWCKNSKDNKSSIYHQ